jgi:hypothetical protein
VPNDTKPKDSKAVTAKHYSKGICAAKPRRANILAKMANRRKF